MSEDIEAPEAAEAKDAKLTVYAIPEAAHRELVQIHKHLCLMAHLTALSPNATADDKVLRPEAIAWWISRMQQDIEAIVDATFYATEVALAYRYASRDEEEAPTE